MTGVRVPVERIDRLMLGETAEFRPQGDRVSAPPAGLTPPGSGIAGSGFERATPRPGFDGPSDSLGSSALPEAE